MLVLCKYNTMADRLWEMQCSFLIQVIPPKEWVARASGYDNIDLVIPAPIKQEALSGSKGIFKVINVANKSMTVKEYQQLANSSRYYNR